MLARKTLFSGQRLLALALLLSQTTTLVPLPVLAGDGSVRVAGQVVIVNKTGSGELSVDKRTATIQDNLDNALVAAKDRSPSSVNISYVKGLPVITLSGYQVVTVDDASAKAYGTSPALLAKRWADALRQALTDTASIDSYVAQLSGQYQASAPQAQQSPAATQTQVASSQSSAYPQPPQPGPPYGQGQYSYGSGYSPAQSQYAQPSGQPVQRGRITYAPAGLTLSASLSTAISTQIAKPGDLIQASISQSVQLGDSSIPAGSVLIGQITQAKAGGFLGRSGMLGVQFNRLRTPDGVETPITAHIVGGIGKYTDVGGDQSDTVKGETWKTKLGQGVIRTGIGAGAGAALGTAVGAIAGRSGRATGRGAWSGTAIGAGVGAVDSLVLRKGRDVTVASGTQMQVQLDAPVSISGGGVPPYTGAF